MSRIKISRRPTGFSGKVSKAHRKCMSKSVVDFKKYVLTYGDNEDVSSYPASIVVDDMIYCLGIALYGRDVAGMASGYNEFKKALIEYLSPTIRD